MATTQTPAPPRRIYMDHAATARPLPEVVAAMLPYLAEEYGSPQSFHRQGSGPAHALKRAREQVGGLIGAPASQITFTSGGIEANNLAVKGAALAYERRGKHIVTTEVEHYSVHHSVKFLEKLGFETTLVKVDGYGRVDPQAVVDALRDDTILVSVQLANQEVGTLQPVAEVARLVKAHNKQIIVHTDATYAVGQIPVDVATLGVDLLSLTAHRFYGPKGAGALYAGKGVRLTPLIHGGVQENGKRAGTENVPAIVGLGVAAERAAAEMEARVEKVRGLRDRLERGLLERIENVQVNGHPSERLPGYLDLSIEGIEGEGTLVRLDLDGIAVASGSACASMALKGSPVLHAIGVDEVLAQGSILITLGIDNTDADIDDALEEIPKVVATLRAMSPIYGKRKHYFR
ncbi:MAG: cysteine desulfurase NifS [Nitrospirae bacterium CG18_big_fil_WC_8_21_14_2_50_70_55]|nr:cysteine desulfurase [Deltaproteobacteria bacterium]OIP66765.1 MAG: cysteine desulfurase NifS [Nitrospirae bacterium CG2_30_70_394]PIQ06369.1 MAG: cysteine desulfurase NifS [Nitrospirae bacterium CG18_big_fil_WC_8_21_14_2_50_70_55]PIU77340.1 MAG: cysteine desulfurase NifS [Nitrospirae bacterium CG06_land_8_20_14_3_00_70_43]PIW83896.1 MAG: cysteine desulfurase NifS [Nitrospirae bacterium CG_4_8_14_3_um_filter_70_85]PIX82808.1 MAG: cysteine desulfurase NifS [Nitrospirae bacterium CG_4_10_14_3